MIHQQFDYSCGSAALATLLRFQYHKQTNEAGVFKAMYEVGDQDRIQTLAALSRAFEVDPCAGGHPFFGLEVLQ